MLYQYLGTDDDEDNPSPKFGAQSAGYATSVSYTHLDVYKRQILFSSQMPAYPSLSV